MEKTIIPVRRQTLSDNLALRIREFIVAHEYKPGDRLPTTARLADQFGVGQPTIREAIKKLQTIGLLEVRHGSGLYVGEDMDSLFLLNPIASEDHLSRKHLLDLIDTRIAIELHTVALAVDNATEAQIQQMDDDLRQARDNFDRDNDLRCANMHFHEHIALASGNSILYQILTLLTRLFKQEQLMILHIFNSKEKDHQQHRQILEALKARDKQLAVKRMKSHLEGVRLAILAWKSEDS